MTSTINPSHIGSKHMPNGVKLSSRVRGLPYINSWVAHPFLMAPSTFGLYTKYSHLELIESYLDDPETHRVSVASPELRGGPFIDFSGPMQDMRDFRDRTLARCAVQLSFAGAITRLYDMLQTSAKGSSLAGLYANIDPCLRHRVELSYDVCKQPLVRFIEPAIYGSPAYDDRLQSIRLEHVSDHPRPFALSTPQLARDASSLELEIPFDSTIWTQLFAGADSQDALLERIRPHMGAPDRDLPLLRQMLVPRMTTGHAARPAPGEVRIRYFGHACVLMESADVSVLVDPLIGYPGEAGPDHFTFDDLPEHIDYVLITHPHMDHIVFETMLRIRDKVGCVVVGRAGGGNLQDVSLKLMLLRCGFARVIELDEYDSVAFEGGRIVGAPFYGEHGDLDVRAKLVYGVQMSDSSCLFFADSNPPSPEVYGPLRKMFPQVDCLFLGMECVGAPASWLYGPMLQKLLTRGEDQARRLDGCDAKAAQGLWAYFDPKQFYVYAMGAEPWLSHITSILYSEDSTQFREARLLERELRARGHHAEVLYGKMERFL